MSSNAESLGQVAVWRGWNQFTQSNDRSGAWFGRRLEPSASFLVAFLVVLASVRGFIVLHSSLSAGVVYQATAACLLCMALFGYLTRNRIRYPDWTLLKRLLQLNLLLGMFNIVVDLLLGAPFDLGLLYQFISPYAIFVLFRVPSRYLNVAILIITVAISYSVCDNFFTTLSGTAGMHKVMAYNAELRPDSFVALSHTGDFFRAGGYTGSYHDSANILGMVASFLGMRFLLQRRLLDLGFFLLAIISMTFTQSAANILVAIFIISSFACYALIRSRQLSTLLYLLLAALGILILVIKFGNLMGIFAARVGSNGDWKGMANRLDFVSLMSAVPYFVVGHATAFGNDIIKTEAALLKIIVQLGIIHALILFAITLYPFYRFQKTKVWCPEAFPPMTATVFGFLSLVHYGSLFRVTSVYMFFTFFVMALVAMARCEASHTSANDAVALV